MDTAGSLVNGVESSDYVQAQGAAHSGLWLSFTWLFLGSTRQLLELSKRLKFVRAIVLKALG